MKIKNEDILALKRTISLTDVVRSRGVELKKKGRQLWGLCPFHSDGEPSFAVDERKGLWNCLGKCGEGGDALSFVMRADGIDFKQAFELLSGNSPQRRRDAEQAETRAPGSVPSEPSTKTEAEYLEKAVAYYHKSLVKNEKAIEYLKTRGITAEAVRVFRLGYVDGSLRGKLNPDGRASLERLGLLNERGNETMYGSVVFPLVDAGTNQVVGLYGRKVETQSSQRTQSEEKSLTTDHRPLTTARHLYLSGGRRGVFNPAGAKETDEIILAESVIDALALWSAETSL
jgi:DNA primase catalytic core